MGGYNVAIIGSRISAEVYLRALIKHQGQSPETFFVMGNDIERCREIKQKYKIKAAVPNQTFFIPRADVIFIAVDIDNLDDIPSIAEKIREVVPPNILISSVTPSLKIAEIEHYFPNHPVIRLGLNIGILSGNGTGAFCCGSVDIEDTLPVARYIIESLGTLIETENEDEFEKISEIIHAQSCGCLLALTSLFEASLKAGLTMEQAFKITTGVNYGITATVIDKQSDDFGMDKQNVEIMLKMPGYEKTVNAGLKLLDKYGMIQAVDKSTHIDIEELKDNLVKIRNAAKSSEKISFHYKHW